MNQRDYYPLQVHNHYLNFGFKEVDRHGEIVREVEFSCNKVSGMYQYCKNNFGKEVAEAFLTETLRVKFHNLAYHLKTLQQVKPEHFRSMSQVEAISMLLRFAAVLQDYNLEQCCRTIIKLESDMRDALPPPEAKTYVTCVEAINDMVKFCKRRVE